MLLFWLCIELVEAARRMVRMPMVECTENRKPMDNCRTRIKKDHCISTLEKIEDLNFDHFLTSHQDAVK